MYEGVPLKHPPETETGSYAFAFNVDGAEHVEPLELIPGHWLQRATTAQIAELRPFIPELTDAAGNPILAGRWEVDISMWAGGGFRIEGRAPRENWRYAVINLTGTRDRTHVLQLAMNLRSPGLVIGLRHLVGPDGAATIYDDVMLRVLDRPADNLLLPVSREDAAELRKLVEQISAHDNAVLDLGTQLERFDALRHVNRKDFVYLGYFTIVESLLAHKPKPEDPYDSITRQVVGKMNLLSKRFDEGLPIADAFGALSVDKVWKLLYAYRSCIAHGTTPDFNKDLAALKNANTAVEFMRTATTRLLKQALVEPVLIRDLKGVTV